MICDERLGVGFKHFVFSPLPGEDDPIWLILFKWVETTNERGSIIFFWKWIVDDWCFGLPGNSGFLFAGHFVKKNILQCTFFHLPLGPNRKEYTLRIQVCPKKGISPVFLFWGWDWDHQSYSREGYGSLGIKNPIWGSKYFSTWLSENKNTPIIVYLWFFFCEAVCLQDLLFFFFSEAVVLVDVAMFWDSSCEIAGEKSQGQRLQQIWDLLTGGLKLGVYVYVANRSDQILFMSHVFLVLNLQSHLQVVLERVLGT